MDAGHVARGELAEALGRGVTCDRVPGAGRLALPLNPGQQTVDRSVGGFAFRGSMCSLAIRTAHERGGVLAGRLPECDLRAQPHLSVMFVNTALIPPNIGPEPYEAPYQAGY